MAFTKLEPNSINTAASFTFANVASGNIKTDHLLYANGEAWTLGSVTGAAGSNTQVQFNTDGNFNAVANLTFDTTTNTLSATNLTGNGAGLTSITGANITGEVSFAAVANSMAGANVSGYVSDATHATSADESLVSFSVAGSNVVGEVAFSAISNSVAGANVDGQVGNAVIAGTVYTNAQPNITSVGILSSLEVSGSTTLSGLTGLVDGAFSGDVSIVGNLTVSGTTTTVSTESVVTANTFILLHDSGEPLVTNDNKDIGVMMRVFTDQDAYAFMGRAHDTGALEYYSEGQVDSNYNFIGDYGNIKAASFISNVATGTAPFFVESTTEVANLYASKANTVVGASQPNITSLGTLVSANVSGNIRSGNANLGNLVTANFYSGNGSGLSSITGANVTGFVPNANVANSTLTSINLTTTNDTSTNTTYYPVFQTATGGSNPLKTASSSLTYNPSTATLHSNAVSASGITTATFTSTSTTNLGPLTNVKISGGLSGQVITTDGLGNLTWAAGGTGGSGSAGGAGFINLTKDTFTATGSSNSYTLSITPSSVAYIVVNIDGIVQQLDAYTLSTNIVTLTGMPAAGEVIEITSYGVGGLPGGDNTEIQFNDNGVFQGAPALTFNTGTSTLTASKYSGNGAGLSSITGANVTGFVPNANVANSALIVSATSLPDVTSLGTLTSLSVTGNILSGNANLGNLVTANFFSGGGNLLSNIQGGNVVGDVPNAAFSTNSGIALEVANAYQPNITSFGNLTSLTVAGLTTSQLTSEIIIPKSGATGVVVHDVSTSSIFLHTSIASNFTVNFTNLPTTNYRSLVVALILSQGLTGYIPNAVQVAGVAQTINWVGGVAPTGLANKKEVVAFTLIRSGGAWIVLGQLASYG